MGRDLERFPGDFFRFLLSLDPVGRGRQREALPAPGTATGAPLSAPYIAMQRMMRLRYANVLSDGGRYCLRSWRRRRPFRQRIARRHIPRRARPSLVYVRDPPVPAVVSDAEDSAVRPNAAARRWEHRLDVVHVATVRVRDAECLARSKG